MKKKPRALIFTGLKQTWFKNCVNFLAGEWCLKNFRDYKVKKFKYKVSERENYINEIKDIKICNFYYERLLKDIIKNFEKKYNVNWCKKSWEVFLGPIVQQYVTIIYDRFNIIKYALNKYNINKVTVTEDKYFNLVTQDLNELRINAQKDDWNLKLFSKLYLNYFKKKKIKINKIKLKGKNYKIYDFNFYKINKFIILKNKFFKFFISFFDNYTKNIYYRTYFNSKKIIFFLNLLKRNIPLIYSFDYKIPKVEFISTHRKTTIESNLKLNNFEKILRDLFFEILPLYYLEKFNFLKKNLNNLFLPITKERKIYTSTGIWHDDIFKFWLSESLSNKSKLYSFQHGCNYGVAKYSNAEFMELKVSDKFYTWGWKNKKRNLKSFLSVSLSNRKKSIKNFSKKVLIVLGGFQTYKIDNTTGNIFTRRAYIYYDEVKRLVNGILKLQPKNNILLKPFPGEQRLFCNLSYQIKKQNSSALFENTKKKLIDILNKYGVIIHTYNSTAFLETMALNKPTFLIFSNELYKNKNRKESESYYKHLKSVKILHSSPEKLLMFLQKINFKFNDWWYKKETQKVRKYFCDQYCRTDNNFLKKLKKI